MKKLFKNCLFTYLLGVVLTITLGYSYATEMITAKNITYKKSDGTVVSSDIIFDELFNSTKHYGEFKKYSLSIPKGVEYTRSVDLGFDPVEFYIFGTYVTLNWYNKEVLEKFGNNGNYSYHNGYLVGYNSNLSSRVKSVVNGVITIYGHESGATSYTIYAR